MTSKNIKRVPATVISDGKAKEINDRLTLSDQREFAVDAQLFESELGKISTDGIKL